MVDSGTALAFFGPYYAAFGARIVVPTVVQIVESCAIGVAKCEADAPVAAKHTNITAMLGKWPQYVQQAKEGGYRYFNLGKFWNIADAIKPGSGLKANLAFLDRIIDRGEAIVWSTTQWGSPLDPSRVTDPRAGVFKEFQYLTERGYKLWTDGYNFYSAISPVSQVWTQVP